MQKPALNQVIMKVGKKYSRPEHGWAGRTRAQVPSTMGAQWVWWSAILLAGGVYFIALKHLKCYQIQHPKATRSPCYNPLRCKKGCRSIHLFFLVRLSPKIFSFAIFSAFTAFPAPVCPSPLFCSGLLAVQPGMLRARQTAPLISLFLLFLMIIPSLFWPNPQWLLQVFSWSWGKSRTE